MAIAVELHTEVRTRVRAHRVGDTVAVTIGDDVTGVRLMGEAADVRRVVTNVMEQLLELEQL